MPVHDLRCTSCLAVEQDAFCKNADQPSACNTCGGARTVYWGHRAKAPHFAGQLLVDNPYGPGLVPQSEAIEAVAAQRGVDPSTLTIGKAVPDDWKTRADSIRQKQLDAYRRRGYDEVALARLRRDNDNAIRRSR